MHLKMIEGLEDKMAVLTTIGLEKSYGGLKAVAGVDFSLEKGRVTGLLGPNGAGKSTTISMVSTLLKPDQGKILYEGRPIEEQLAIYRRKLGVVPQEIALYPELSGKRNLEFWGRVNGLRGKELEMRLDAVSEIIGIDGRLKDPVDKYSGGMKRRINIGAALLHEPEILIMDEPTVGIDPQSRKHILDTVKTLNGNGMTVLYTSHYMEEVSYLCDDIHIMDHGRIIAHGTESELVALNGDGNRMKLQLDVLTQELQEAIKVAFGVGAVTLSDGNGVVIPFGQRTMKETFDAVLQIVDTLAEPVGITSMEVEKESLETVFLRFTGRALRD